MIGTHYSYQKLKKKLIWIFTGQIIDLFNIISFAFFRATNNNLQEHNYIRTFACSYIDRKVIL